ncbi:hypothetical protein HELRODRAFT_183974 [Helobdella robusta]|uniref:Uncharacterized protein n=1 Tax=Helobdella robusta TaxID=6412 RepID=T1FKD8_HELRO|nr:hypothetical protein HELRODRAFT_183974 [Helobdella robusta]ESO09656.1 hypothetical protein HELRODRAFT_183974 [Helobdella robusta]
MVPNSGEKLKHTPKLTASNYCKDCNLNHYIMRYCRWRKSRTKRINIKVPAAQNTMKPVDVYADISSLGMFKSTFSLYERTGNDAVIVKSNTANEISTKNKELNNFSDVMSNSTDYMRPTSFSSSSSSNESGLGSLIRNHENDSEAGKNEQSSGGQNFSFRKSIAWCNPNYRTIIPYVRHDSLDGTHHSSIPISSLSGNQLLSGMYGDDNYFMANYNDDNNNDDDNKIDGALMTRTN